jgi:hypothetical protein
LRQSRDVRFFKYTNVELSKANFKIVQRDAHGEAISGYVFGVSQSFGAVSTTMAVARVTGSQMLHGEAVDNLWKNVEKTINSIEGKKRPVSTSGMIPMF